MAYLHVHEYPGLCAASNRRGFVCLSFRLRMLIGIRTFPIYWRVWETSPSVEAIGFWAGYVHGENAKQELDY